MPVDVAGQIEIYEFNNISDEDVFDNDELHPLKKKSKSKSVRGKLKWKEMEDVLLSYNEEEEPVRLAEDFPYLPYLKPFDLFHFYFSAMVSKITTETMRYARLKITIIFM